MKKILSLTSFLVFAVAAIVAPSAFADTNRGYFVGKCQYPSGTITASCTVQINNYYTGAVATIYSDNVGGGTALANPFTADANGIFKFYADDGTYSPVISGLNTGSGSAVNSGAAILSTVTIVNGSVVSTVIGSITPSSAGGATVGSRALPFSSVYIGGAATNNVQVTATATGARTFTLPDATDTAVGKATTDTFTNKTYDTAGSGNSFSINGVAATANTGTGSVVRATSPTLVTPALGVATATSVNKVTLTTPATGSTLTIVDGKTFSVSNTITLAGTDAQTYTFPSASDTVVTLAATQTLTNKTLTSSAVTTDIHATAAGSGTVGTVALPFASVIVGTAATNNLTVTPAAFAAGVTATVDDPAVAAMKLPLVRRGTIAWTTGAVGAGACSAAQTASITGLATTAVVYGNINATDTNFLKGLVPYFYPTANTVNVQICNPTAGSLTPTGGTVTFNYVAFLP